MNPQPSVLETDALPIELLAYPHKRKRVKAKKQSYVTFRLLTANQDFLFSSYLMNCTFAFALTKFIKLYFRCTFSDADIGTIVPLSALFTLKPNVLSFAFSLSHKLSHFSRHYMRVGETINRSLHIETLRSFEAAKVTQGFLLRLLHRRYDHLHE